MKNTQSKIIRLLLSFFISTVFFVNIALAGASSDVSSFHQLAYTNVFGQEVSSPIYSKSIPKGAKARCKDGTYSFSRSRRGTCSGHRGVSKWL